MLLYFKGETIRKVTFLDTNGDWAKHLLSHNKYDSILEPKILSISQVINLPQDQKGILVVCGNRPLVEFQEYEFKSWKTVIFYLSPFHSLGAALVKNLEKHDWFIFLTGEEESAFDFLKSKIENNVDNFRASKLLKIRKENQEVLLHELKTPLQTIQLASEVLKDQKIEADSYVSLSKSIIESVEKIEALLDTDLHQLEDDSLSTEGTWTPFSTVAKSIESVFSLLSIESNIEFEVINNLKDHDLYCDKTRTHQAISNLISNAFKFTHKKGEISLSFSRETGRAVIEVSDSGQGVSDSRLKNIWKRKWTSDSKQGSGLGLFITKEIVESQGWSITCSSRKNVGTTFKICIPLDQIRIHKFKKKKQKQIVLIEDDIELAEVIKVFLSSMPVDLELCHTSQEALDILDRIIPDLIISDINLSHSEKVYDYPMLRTHLTNIPALVVSGSKSELSEISNWIGGQFKSIEKPFKKSEFKEKVLKLLDV